MNSTVERNEIPDWKLSPTCKSNPVCRPDPSCKWNPACNAMFVSSTSTHRTSRINFKHQPYWLCMFQSIALKIWIIKLALVLFNSSLSTSTASIDSAAQHTTFTCSTEAQLIFCCAADLLMAVCLRPYHFTRINAQIVCKFEKSIQNTENKYRQDVGPVVLLLRWHEN